MKKSKLLWKLLAIIPYWILMSLTEIMRPEPSSETLSSILWYSLFGRVSAGDIKTLTLSMESLGGVFLFVLLFGDYIAAYFTEISVYIFTRVRDRSIWTIKKIGAVVAYSAFFAEITILIKGYTCLLQKEEIQITKELLYAVIVTFVLLFLLLTQIGILSNFISTKFGSIVGVFSALVTLITLSILSIALFNNKLNQILNPLCFNIVLLDKINLMIAKIAISIVYLLMIIAVYTEFIYKLDIYGK